MDVLGITHMKAISLIICSIVLGCPGALAIEIDFAEVSHSYGKIFDCAFTDRGELYILHASNGGPTVVTMVDDTFAVTANRRQIGGSLTLCTSFPELLTISRNKDRTLSVGASEKLLWSSPAPLTKLLLARSNGEALLAGRGVDGLLAWRATLDFSSVVPLDTTAVNTSRIEDFFGFDGILAVLRRDGLYQVNDSSNSPALHLKPISLGKYVHAAVAVGLKGPLLFVVPAKMMVSNEIEMRSFRTGAVLWHENVGFGNGVVLLQAESLPDHQLVALLYKSKHSLREAEVIVLTEDGEVLARRNVSYEARLASGSGRNKFVLFDDSTFTVIEILK